MNAALYGRVRQILASARAGVVRSVNTAQVVANWLIGREIVEEEQKGERRAGYGKKLLDGLASRITADFGPGYSVQNLSYMKQFYLVYGALLAPERILHALRGESGGAERGSFLHAVRGESGTPSGGESWRPGRLHPNLSWTHYRTLLRVARPEARAFYEIEALNNHWAARELERQINSVLYERLARSKDQTGVLSLATKGHQIHQPADVFKDPVVIEFLGLPESPRLVESDLEEALITHLQSFLLELGKGFAFVARQKRITLDGDHFYVDLVFYHVVLKCYIVVDLKTTRLTHADLGQLQLYVNYFDREERTPGDHPTLGLVLCTDKNDTVVKYTLAPNQQQIFTSRYQMHLPSVTELHAELRRELKDLRDP